MRSNLEFRSSVLNDGNRQDELPRGEAVARLIAAGLPDFGFSPKEVDYEDWGWCIKIANETFALWIGCGGYAEYDNGHLCFIEPKKQCVRRWFRKVPTVETVERLATAVETIVQRSGKASDLRWWTEEENARG
jgi:hypothetical protein